MGPFLLTFLVIFGLQVAFFIVAAAAKTDKVTDISYGLTFGVVAWLLCLSNPVASTVQLVLTLCVSLWSLRLALYLFIRILGMGRDRRFDGIREGFWSFAKFWIL